ncbi:MAG: DUF1800 family protein [Pseudoalteromonas sp.]|uniref:DUF1800 domain-containing protein n=1 Tax=unclassified Pseudoalteromonas TaxID=194690 RepID=UPI000C07A587|nr:MULTISPECIES: DUF1800 family protein [unclassified Pseudoalteromonas]MDP2634005.1 DUF1800 family protein [Pseudoalteromonas sp. 1_MG-2023]PHN90763.1 hypothetical protein CSC79_06410 [Pseudoalteromonas sp. 3D05]
MSKRIALAILTSCFLVACGGGNEANTSKETPVSDTPTTPPASGDTSDDDTTTENTAPVISLSPPDSVSHGQTLTLNASASDSDGDTLTYNWQQLAGQPIETSDNEVLTLTIPSPLSGYDEAYRFLLRVTDEHGAQSEFEFGFTAKATMDSSHAARLLHQASLGPTYEEILSAQGLSAEEWIDSQMQLPITYHVDYLENYPNRDYPRQINRIDAWWKGSINAPDQLRQRVAYAMSQIFVVSDFNNSLANEPKGMVSYYDMLLENAFGNYRDILETISRSPIMGKYLDHLGNEKADEERNIRPDENYARELLQLFSIGLEELSLNGLVKKDINGQPVPAYTQADIEGFAKVFTGWTFGASEFWGRPSNNHSILMSPFEAYHSTAEKHLISDVVIPANTDAETSLKIALDTIFAHPNIAPFISKQLILKLITSNPSPSYIERVAKIFNDNGQGVKGDLSAVIKAIYLDPEARQFAAPLAYFGKVREPLLKQMQLWRVFKAKSLNNRYYTSNLSLKFGQGPLQSPSVFNFYQPDHQPQELSGSMLVAPELQIANDAYVINTLNTHFDEMSRRVAERYDELNENYVYLYMGDDLELLANFGLNAVIDKYDTLFFAGAMSHNMRNAIYDMDAYFSSSESHLRLSYIVYLITVSAEYSLQQ